MTMLGRHHSDEAKAKMSAASKGRIFSLEHRANLSTAHIGQKSHLGHHEHGWHQTEEARAKIAAAMTVRVISDETRAKESASHWKGGRNLSQRKSGAKRRRALGYILLNAPFVGCVGHHVDAEQVINMPAALHRSIYHRQDTGQGMAQMNAIAYNYLFKQEVEAAIAAKETA